MQPSVDKAIRQASVVYFKNEVLAHWSPRENKDTQLVYSVHEQDKELIRNLIVDAVVVAPDTIRHNLATALTYVIKHDFPEKWPGVVQKIDSFLDATQPQNWLGALIALHQLVKNYEYRNNTEKAPLLDAMKILGPKIYKMMIEVSSTQQSEESANLQKVILKTVYCLTQYSLPLTFFTFDLFTQWMEVFRQVLDRPLPLDTINKVDPDDRDQLPWYKAKKWAIRILTRIFDRYATPQHANSEYKKFSVWYMKTFSVGIIQVILKTLDQYTQGVYYPNRIVQQCITYLTTGLVFLLDVSLIHYWHFINIQG